jgi:hypothetical protein
MADDAAMAVEDGVTDVTDAADVMADEDDEDEATA